MSKRGFSLIELLIVMIIIATLLTVAVPSYRSYLIKAHRVDGQTALFALAIQLEKQGYEKPLFNPQSPQNFYKIFINNITKTYFLISAVPFKPDKQCPVLAMNSLGQKGILQNGKFLVERKCW